MTTPSSSSLVVSSALVCSCSFFQAKLRVATPSSCSSPCFCACSGVFPGTMPMTTTDLLFALCFFCACSVFFRYNAEDYTKLKFQHARLKLWQDIQRQTAYLLNAADLAAYDAEQFLQVSFSVGDGLSCRLWSQLAPVCLHVVFYRCLFASLHLFVFLSTVFASVCLILSRWLCRCRSCSALPSSACVAIHLYLCLPLSLLAL